MACSCAKFSKISLLIFNVLFLLAGLAVLAAGIYFYVETTNKYYIPQSWAVGTIVTAGVVVLFSIFGIVAAATANKVMLWIYFVVLILILGGEIAVAVYAYAYNSSFISYTANYYRNSLTNESRLAVENNLYCCGFNNITDSPAGGTCCQIAANLSANASYSPPTESPSTPNYCIDNANLTVIGCLSAYEQLYDTYSVYLEAGAGVLAGIEIFGMIFAVALAVKADEAKDMEMNDYS